MFQERRRTMSRVNHPADIETLADLFRSEKVEVYLIRPEANPLAFGKRTLSFVVNTTLRHLKRMLPMASPWKPSRIAESVGNLEVVGPEKQSIVSIDALSDIPIGHMREVMSFIFGEGWGPEFLLAIKDSGLLAKILPELQDCVDINGGGHHQETVFEHLIGSLEHARNYRPIVQWAILLHDIGKPNTINEESDGRITFHRHDVVGATAAYHICRRFKFSEIDTRYIVNLVRHHMFRFASISKEKSIRKWLLKLGKEGWQDLFRLRAADRQGNKANKNKPTITREMKELRDRIEEITSSSLLIFREDLNVREENLIKVVGPEQDMRVVYANLLGAVNSDTARRNNQEWILDLARRIYAKGNSNTM